MNILFGILFIWSIWIGIQDGVRMEKQNRYYNE